MSRVVPVMTSVHVPDDPEELRQRRKVGGCKLANFICLVFQLSSIMSHVLLDNCESLREVGSFTFWNGKG